MGYFCKSSYELSDEKLRRLSSNLKNCEIRYIGKVKGENRFDYYIEKDSLSPREKELIEESDLRFFGH